MVSFVQIVAFFWMARTIKFVLFWIYLWQLKEYHVGRFLDHFKTHKGKQLIFNLPLVIKAALVLFILADGAFVYVLLPLYAVEFSVFCLAIIKKKFKHPKLTTKALWLMLVSLVVSWLFLSQAFALNNTAEFSVSLLFFDLCIPVFISCIVLFFQPFFAAVRGRILRKAKQKMAQFSPPAGGLKVIGITGSYGKTSTKEFLSAILSAKFKVLATPEHKNSEIGIAQTILHDLKPDHQFFIVEMGSYKKGGITLLCNMVEPEIGLVTGVNQQHLATFGSMDNLLSAEGGRELLHCLPKHGLLVVNGDNKHCLALYKNANIRKQIYTVKRETINSDIWTEDMEIEQDNIFFIAMARDATLAQGSPGFKKDMAHFHVDVLGAQQVQNMLGAILVAKDLGMSLEEISQACRNIRPKQAGMTLAKGIHGINIIDASYSSNPDGVMADLDYLAIFPHKKVIVMPCLIELGSQSAEVHTQIGKKIAQVCDLAIITTQDKFKEIKTAAVAEGMSENRILFCDNPQEIFGHITTACKAGDAVLLEGRVPGELITLLNGR